MSQKIVKFDDKLDFSSLVFTHLNRISLLIMQPEQDVDQLGRAMDGLEMLCGWMAKGGGIDIGLNSEKPIPRNVYYTKCLVAGRKIVKLLEQRGYMPRTKIDEVFEQ